MRVSVNYEFYSKCRTGNALSNNAPLQEVWNFAWKTINSIRSMIITKRALTNVGRYYLSTCTFILDFIEIMGNDISVRIDLCRICTGNSKGNLAFGFPCIRA